MSPFRFYHKILLASCEQYSVRGWGRSKEPSEEIILTIQVRGAGGWTQVTDSNAGGETSLSPGSPM